MKKRSRKWPMLISYAAFLSPLAILALYGLINFNGARRWAATVRMLEADGETVDFEALWPEPVPDEENFFAIPLLNGLGTDVTDHPELALPEEQRRRLEAVNVFEKSGEWDDVRTPRLGSGHRDPALQTDLDLWVAFFRATGRLSPDEDGVFGEPEERVLEAMSEWEGVFEELAEGLDRPRARILPGFGSIGGDVLEMWSRKVNLGTITSLIRTLALRSVAASRAGDGKKAWESVAIFFRLNEALREDGPLMYFEMAAAMTSMSMDATWEPLRTRVLKREELEQLQAGLERVDVEAYFLTCIRIERAGVAQALDIFKEERPADYLTYFYEFPDPGDFGSAIGITDLDVLYWFFPGGWFDVNKASAVAFLHEYGTKPLKEGGCLAVIAADAEARKFLSDEFADPGPSNFMAGEMLTGLRRPARSAVLASCSVEQATAAVALERYYLANGRYPERLEELVPEFCSVLPVDVIDGASMRYRRDSSNGRYVLYSLGWDGVDDGGVRVLDAAGPRKTHYGDLDYTGDWVWSYASPESDAAAKAAAEGKGESGPERPAERP